MREDKRGCGQKTKAKHSGRKRVVRTVGSWEWADAQESSGTEGSLGCVLCGEVGKPVRARMLAGTLKSYNNDTEGARKPECALVC